MTLFPLLNSIASVFFLGSLIVLWRVSAKRVEEIPRTVKFERVALFFLAAFLVTDVMLLSVAGENSIPGSYIIIEVALLFALCALLAFGHTQRRAITGLTLKIGREEIAGRFTHYEKFSPYDLKRYRGYGGKRALIAYKGKVYDVTGSQTWENGIHLFRHSAGFDLTAAIKGAPHTDAKMENLRVVGEYDPDADKSGSAMICEAEKKFAVLGLVTGFLAILSFLLFVTVLCRNVHIS